MQKVKKDAGISQIMQLATSMWGYLDTNIDVFSAVGIARTVISNGVTNTEEWRMPGSKTAKGESRNGTWAYYDIDFEENASRLYKFIYQS